MAVECAKFSFSLCSVILPSKLTDWIDYDIVSHGLYGPPICPASS
jgi:hypothetical protein